MKRFIPVIMLFVGVGLIVSCGKKSSPEEEIKDYGKYFVEKLKANQLDSLKNSYPGITEADSIVPIKSDTIIVAQITPGEYDLTLAEGVVLKVSRSEDGNISVTDSKGLFAFPSNKLEIAKKTGMASDSLSDKDLANRFKDKDFFDYMDKQIEEKKNSILTYTNRLTVTKEPAYMMDSGSGYYTITNNTDQNIKGSDYSMIFKYTYMGYGSSSSTKTEPGKDIPAKGSVQIVKGFSGHDFVEFKGIIINIPEEELFKTFIPFSGNEYQEYLDSKK